MKRMAMDNIKYTNRSIHIKLNYQKLRIINSMNLQSLVFDVKKRQQPPFAIMMIIAFTFN